MLRIQTYVQTQDKNTFHIQNKAQTRREYSPSASGSGPEAARSVDLGVVMEGGCCALGFT